MAHAGNHRGPRAFLRWFIVAAILGGMGGCSGESPSEATPTTEESQGTHAEGEPPSREAEAADTEATWLTVFDLTVHPARARRYRGGHPFIDLGGDGTGAYTLGGWRTRTGDVHTFGDTDALLIEGVTGEVFVPSEQEGPLTLSVRLRSFGQPQGTLYFNGETVRHLRFPRDGSFVTVHADLSETQVHRGENTLQVRVPQVREQDGVRAGVAIDWIQLAPTPPSETPEQEETRPTETAPSPPRAILQLAAEETLAWTLDAPEGARLRFDIEGAGRILWRTASTEAPRRLAAFGSGGSVSVPAGFGELRFEATAPAHIRSAVVEQVVEDAPPTVERPRPTPRNVLVFLVDTVRADKLRPFNPASRVQTPGLDHWARRTAVFQQGRTQENWTKPSVATLLTGLLPWQHTATSGEAVLPRSAELLSERLRDEGFQTGAFICNGYVSDPFGFRQGWGFFRNYIREGRRTQARFVAADVLEWLDGRDEEKPFFLYIHTIDPHVPYMPPPEMLALYDDAPYDGPVDFSEDREMLEKIKSGRVRTNARDRRRLEALYDGEITYHDVHFASILEGLERRGLADDTMVVFTADHGEEFFDHDSVGHGHSLFEELLHVPFIVRLPGLTDQRVDVEEAVGLVDVVPTVLDALRLERPDGLPGRSLLPLMEGERSPAPVPVVSGFMEGWRAVVVGRYKLIQRTHRRAMVYDLEADPREQHDLAEERPMLLRHLRAMLGLALSGRVGPRHQAESTEIDAETEAQLRALGYVGTQRPQ